MFRRSGYRFADKNMRQSIVSRACLDSEGTEHALADHDASAHMTLERFGRAGLERFCSLARDLLGKRREFLGLLGEDAEALARMLGRHFEELRRRLHAIELAGIVESRIGVGAGDLDKLGVVLH